MKKLGIVITDGVGFRNFIMSNFIEEAREEFDEIIIYSGLPINIYNSFSSYPNVYIKELGVFVEGNSTWFLGNGKK